METATKNTALTAAEIRTMNLSATDSMSYDYEDEVYYLVINGVRRIGFDFWRNREKSFNKIKDMGLCLAAPKDNNMGDEFEGFCQAGQQDLNFPKIAEITN